jgi:hypothetical protein
VIHVVPQLVSAVVQGVQAVQAVKAHHEVAYQLVRGAMRARRLYKLYR